MIKLDNNCSHNYGNSYCIVYLSVMHHLQEKDLSRIASTAKKKKN